MCRVGRWTLHTHCATWPGNKLGTGPALQLRGLHVALLAIHSTNEFIISTHQTVKTPTIALTQSSHKITLTENERISNRNPFNTFKWKIRHQYNHTAQLTTSAISACAPSNVAQPQLALWSSVASVMLWPSVESLRPLDDGLRPTALPTTHLSTRQRGLRVVPRTDADGEKTFGHVTVRTNGGVPGASPSPSC